MRLVHDLWFKILKGSQALLMVHGKVKERKTTSYELPTINQIGQIALIVILIMTAALGVGLSIINRTLTDISTSSDIEQSSRAFSAAEAGIERALQRINSGSPIDANFLIGTEDLDDASANVTVRGNLNSETIEHKKLVKEDVGQIWLADPTVSTLPGYYSGTQFEVFFGNQGITSDKPALEVNVITRTGAGVYQANRTYIDSETLRTPPNNFTVANCNNPTITTTDPDGGKFHCRHTITWPAGVTPVLARFRLLYSTAEQALAVRPVGGLFPPDQIKTVTAVGIAGETQRTVRVTTEQKAVPPLFDYVLFSVTDIKK